MMKLKKNMAIMILILFMAVTFAVGYPAVCDACEECHPDDVHPHDILEEYLQNYQQDILAGVMIHEGIDSAFLDYHRKNLNIHKIFACSPETWRKFPELQRYAVLVIAKDNTTVRTASIKIDDKGNLQEDRTINELHCQRYDICIVSYVAGETAPQGVVLLTKPGHPRGKWLSSFGDGFSEPEVEMTIPDEPIYYVAEERF